MTLRSFPITLCEKMLFIYFQWTLFRSSKNRLTIWIWNLFLILGESLISSGSIKTSSAGRWKEVIPLAILSACFLNGFDMSIMYFPDITNLNFLNFFQSFKFSSDAVLGGFALVSVIETPRNVQRWINTCQQFKNKLGPKLSRKTATPYNRINFQWQMLMFFSQMVNYR